eukprot:403356593
MNAIQRQRLITSNSKPRTVLSARVIRSIKKSLRSANFVGQKYVPSVFKTSIQKIESDLLRSQTGVLIINVWQQGNHDHGYLGQSQKENSKTFKCLICKETNIPFFEFKEHFEEICPEIVVTCQGCKIHECARSKLRFHINDCEYSEHQCNKCDQNYILKDLKTHDCFSMLEHKFNQVLKENLNLEAIIGDLKAKDQKQRATFKELVINIKQNNKQIEQLNRDLSGEAQLETQAFGSKFCKKCQNGVGHLTCALCKDYMCFGQQEPINKSLCYKEQINGDQFNYYFSINLFLNTKISLSSQPFLIKLLQKNQIQSYILAPTKW